ncbi:extracellular solute-binding protein [Microbacterium sp. zg.Y625]|uniref:ABC transporter substrate-binding protein n=1 Tax=Microbacterium jiangjiandongii TaxID=3049071 RepID=UPI00214CEF27|nr:MULTISPECIES: extracellular solute-binding protein [unclassified Microbacterium]MCR2793465.1 extracellular solute-binding protein [Microbacterium sp. zg.Y625]MCR2815357.1 extracellular solute-binding protein [Microbacterium sp. zg.Y843]WIM25164.1 extracellular solute-binding protein [Microbacterium sp. zg-Y625]
MRKRAVASSLLALSLVATGCASADDEAEQPAPAVSGDSEWQSVVDAAKEEGQVTWYSVAPAEVREGLKAAFEAKYPEITLEILTMGTADMNAALEAEHDTGAEGADVVTSVDYGWILDKSEQDWISDLEGPAAELDEWGDYIINGQVANAGLGLMVLGWNTSLYSGTVESYDDLLVSDLGDGALGTARPEPAIHADHWAFVEASHNSDYVAELAEQEPALYPSAFALQEALAAGEVAVGAFVSAADMVGLKSKGAPVEFAVPDPAMAIGNMFFIPASGKNQNAAQVFMDFFLSEEGQAIAAKNAFSPLSSVETLAGDSEVVLTDVDRVLDQDWYTAYLADWKAIYE